MSNLARRIINRPPASPPVDRDRALFNTAMFRLFQTSPGEWLLIWLQETSTEMVLPPDASDSALRMMEGRRQVLADLKRVIESGRRAVNGE